MRSSFSKNFDVKFVLIAEIVKKLVGLIALSFILHRLDSKPDFKTSSTSDWKIFTAIATSGSPHSEVKVIEPATTTLIVPQNISVAEVAWKSFFSEFQAAVKARNRKALSKMMVPEFLYTFGRGKLDRTEAFKFWDNPNINGWNHLDAVIAQGVSPIEKSRSTTDGKSILRRIAPRAAIEKKGYTNWRANFEYGTDARWRFTSFVAGD